MGTPIVVIEHNLDVVKSADWIIDMGPEGGAEGGRIVAIGPPEAIVDVPESYTGKFLRDVSYDPVTSSVRHKPVCSSDRMSLHAGSMLSTSARRAIVLEENTRDPEVSHWARHGPEGDMLLLGDLRKPVHVVAAIL